MIIQPVDPSAGSASTLCYHQNAWSRVLAFLRRAKHTEVVVEVARVTDLGAETPNISLCHIVGISNLQFSNSDNLWTDDSLRAKLSTDRNVLKKLRWRVIAYRPPKEGKTYKNLPESLVIGTVSCATAQIYCTRSTLHRVTPTPIVDEIFGYVYTIVHNIATPRAFETAWRPRLLRQCTENLQNRVLSLSAPRADELAGDSDRFTVKDTSFLHMAKSTPHIPDEQEEASTTKSIHKLLVEQSVDEIQTVREERNPEPCSLLGLPTEILLDIVEHTLHDEGLVAESVLGLANGYPGPAFSILRLPLQDTSSAFRDLLERVCSTRSVCIRYDGSQIDCYLLEEDMPSAYYAGSVSITFDPFPPKLSLPILKQLKVLLRKSPFLTRFRVTVASSQEGFPNRLPVRLKNLVFENVFEPLREICNDKTIHFTLNVDHSHSADDDVTCDGRTILSWAAGHDLRYLIDEIMQKSGARYNRSPQDVQPTALWHAAYRGNAGLVQTLAELDPESIELKPTGWVGWLEPNTSPLGAAAFRGHTDVVRLLYQKGADVNAIDNLSNTPLMLALRQHHYHTMKLLCEFPECDLNAADSKFDTPLMHACRHNYLEAVQYLCNVTGIELNRPGLSPIGSAVEGGHIEIIKLLLERGAEPRESDRIIAIRSSKHEIAILLDASLSEHYLR